MNLLEALSDDRLMIFATGFHSCALVRHLEQQEWLWVTADAFVITMGMIAWCDLGRKIRRREVRP